MATRKSNLNVVFGTMTFGRADREGVRISDSKTASEILENFKIHGYQDLDTSRTYGGGSTEEFLSEINWERSGFKMHTKVYPTKGKSMGSFASEGYSHEPADIRRALMESLKALKTKKIDLYYLHAPDRNTPFVDTLREINALYQEGYFDRFGLSNFMSWEVAQVCEICENNGWIKPSIYQGIYNALHRAIEPELIPCLRKYGMSLYAFQPLAGGFLTGRYTRNMDDSEYVPGSRFDPKRWQGALHRGRYMNDFYFDALDIIYPVAAKHGLTVTECAYRWLNHHSQLSNELGDSIIVGASGLPQFEQNIADLEKGPLPEEVVEALDAGWERVRGVVPKYFH